MKLHHDNVPYLIGRLEAVVDLLKIGEVHMATAKLLADISALKMIRSSEAKKKSRRAK